MAHTSSGISTTDVVSTQRKPSGRRDAGLHARDPEVPRTVRTPVRIVVADGHAMFAQGLRAMLRGRYDVVAVVQDGADVVKTVEELEPDLLLLGLALPNRTGLDVLRDLKSLETSVRVVVISMYRHKVLVDTAVQLGASGFIPKNAEVTELRDAIKEVLAGGRYVSPLLPETGPEGSAQDRIGLGCLTSRQQDIMRLIGRGFRTEDIASKLRISVHTVNFHRKNIRQQLGCHSEWAMLRLAILAELSEGTRCVVGSRLACINATDSRVEARQSRTASA